MFRHTYSIGVYVRMGFLSSRPWDAMESASRLHIARGVDMVRDCFRAFRRVGDKERERAAAVVASAGLPADCVNWASGAAPAPCRPTLHPSQPHFYIVNWLPHRHYLCMSHSALLCSLIYYFDNVSTFKCTYVLCALIIFLESRFMLKWTFHINKLHDSVAFYRIYQQMYAETLISSRKIYISYIFTDKCQYFFMYLLDIDRLPKRNFYSTLCWHLHELFPWKHFKGIFYCAS